MRAGIQRDRFEATIDQLLKDGDLVEYDVQGKRGPSTKRLYPGISHNNP